MMISYYYENVGDDIQTTLMLGEEWLGVEPGGLDRRGVRQINMGVGGEKRQRRIHGGNFVDNYDGDDDDYNISLTCKALIELQQQQLLLNFFGDKKTSQEL